MKALIYIAGNIIVAIMVFAIGLPKLFEYVPPARLAITTLILGVLLVLGITALIMAIATCIKNLFMPPLGKPERDFNRQTRYGRKWFKRYQHRVQWLFKSEAGWLSNHPDLNGWWALTPGMVDPFTGGLDTLPIIHGPGAARPAQTEVPSGNTN